MTPQRTVCVVGLAVMVLLDACSGSTKAPVVAPTAGSSTTAPNDDGAVAAVVNALVSQGLGTCGDSMRSGGSVAGEYRKDIYSFSGPSACSPIGSGAYVVAILAFFRTSLSDKWVKSSYHGDTVAAWLYTSKYLIEVSQGVDPDSYAKIASAVIQLGARPAFGQAVG